MSVDTVQRQLGWSGSSRGRSGRRRTSLQAVVVTDFWINKITSTGLF